MRGKREAKVAKKKRSIWSILLISFLVVVILSVSAFGIFMYSVTDDDFFDQIKGMSLKMNSVVYAKNPDTGKYEQYEIILSEEDRTWVDIEKIPLHMQRAMIAIEDERFYSHNGVDIKRTALAVMKELSGGSEFGGSTITQQLVKNITGDKEHSRGRKIREIARAIAAEQKLTKDEILEMYMNTIYLGQNSYGVASASRAYFNKSVTDLTLAEAAAIVGITKYPTKYDPILNPEENQKRRNIVLDKMCELGYITEEERDNAKKETLNFIGRFSEKSYNHVTSYFTDQVFIDVVHDLMEEKNYTESFATQMVENGGLKIYATIDKRIQAIMDKAYMNENNFVGPIEGGTQSAMVLSDPYTGEIKGIVGGRGKKTAPRVLNRASQSYRQPGSSFKPIAVYAPAIDSGRVVPSSPVDDKPLQVGSWKPKNSGGGFSKSMTVKTAITKSQNIPAINILEAVGIEQSYKYVTEKFHLSTIVEQDKALASLALGGLTNGVSVKELNAAYCSFPNAGIYNEPISYTKVLNNRGEVVLEKKDTESRAISADAAYIMCDMMKNVVAYGTAAGSQIPGMDTAGKTGTSDLSKDRWFAGFTPYYCATVWFGYDSPRAVYSPYSNPALNIWRQVMVEVHKDLEPKVFKQPATLTKLNICINSGKLAGSHCHSVYEFVTSDHKPTSVCTSHNGAIVVAGKYNIKDAMEDEEEQDENGEETPEGGESGEGEIAEGGDPSDGGAIEQPGQLPEGPVDVPPTDLPGGNVGTEIVIPPAPAPVPDVPAPPPVVPDMPPIIG